MSRTYGAVLIALALGLGACDKKTAEPASPRASGPRAAASGKLASATSAAPPQQKPKSPKERAVELAHRFIILDGHIDVPYRLEESKDAKGNLTEDITGRTKEGNFDYPRAREGGLDAPFFSIYIPARYENHGAKKFADGLIDMVEGIAKGAPDKFVLARSPAEVKNAFAGGKIAILMGMENGSPVEHKLENVRHFFDRGIRYITLAHSKDNHLSDSSYDKRHTNHGLSPFGENVVREMNRLGILVDVSHISDEAFADVMKTTRVPVIASHSSCRHFTPGFERNMSDDMIKQLAANGGVIQINFGSDFLDGEIQKANEKHFHELMGVLTKKHLDYSDKRAKPIKKQFWEKVEKRHAKLSQVADHIDHVVKLVGIDHVGLGSDFDGVGDTLPEGLPDVSGYPKLIEVLLERGYSDADIEKICSGNVLRVWQQVDEYAKSKED